MVTSPGVTPIDLPIIIYNIYGCLLELADEATDSMLMHYGIGLKIRNEIRRHAIWTDQELDDKWLAVLRAGAKKTNVINLKYKNGEVVADG